MHRKFRTLERQGCWTWVGRKAVDRAATLVSVLGVVAMLVGCTPVNDPSAGLPTPEAVALIDQAPRSDIKLADLAEAFALGTKIHRSAARSARARARRAHRRVGHPRLRSGFLRRSFRSDLAGDSDREPAEAVPLLRVMVWVLPQNDDDQALLMSVKTDDVIRIRGIVQEIRARTIVAIVPGVVVGPECRHPLRPLEPEP